MFFDQGRVRRPFVKTADLSSKRILICGAGNLLLSDEGFGVHFIRHLESAYAFPPNVELMDAGTHGVLICHRVEQADCVYLVDSVLADAAPPGSIQRYSKDDFLLRNTGLKLSPHQAGIQEILSLAHLRGCCPDEVHLLGVVPESLEPGIELTPRLRGSLQPVAKTLVEELRALGLTIRKRQP